MAYILSMVRGGVPAFTYREIEVLSRHGVRIGLFPLTYRTGAYMPKDDWPVFRPNAVGLIVAQSLAFLRRPGMYLSLLRLALRMHVLREFAVAMLFVRGMRAFGAQHIHCHFGDSKLYTGYFCSLWLDLPLTVTVHAYEIHRNPRPAMFKVAAARCKRIVVQSHYNKNELMRAFGLPEEQFEIIRAHGDMSDERARRSCKILMVAEFREKKGHEVLFKAVHKLQRDDITLWIVGAGDLDVPRIAEETGVSEITVFLGHLGKQMINILYDACDIFVLPSRTGKDGDKEGIPAVLMEAMSHCKPVVTTRHAGIPELVSEVLVDENDVEGLADALQSLIDDPQRRIQLGQRNFQIVTSDFSDSAVLELGRLFTSGSNVELEHA